MPNPNRTIGVNKNARSPSAITNEEHHDPSRSKRTMDGVPGQVETITNDANEHAVHEGAVVRVANDTGGTIYMWTGEAGNSPGTVDNTNGIAILNGTSEIVYMGVSPDSYKSRAYKLSAPAQAVVFSG